VVDRVRYFQMKLIVIGVCYSNHYCLCLLTLKTIAPKPFSEVKRGEWEILYFYGMLLVTALAASKSI
jgi:hypothetical protein